MTRRAATLVTILALCAGGCSFTPEVTGVWRSQEGAGLTWPALGFQGRVELVVGQYGQAVAGMLRLYEEGRDFKENYLFSVCPCLYLDRASFDDGTLVFDVTPCGADAAEWSGRFEWSELEAGEILMGTLAPKTPDSDDAPTAEFVLRLAGGTKLIKEDELNRECPPPTQ